MGPIAIVSLYHRITSHIVVYEETKIIAFIHHPYISMKIEPNGSTPPSITITPGSMNHFFSGIGLGTALTLHGKLGCPASALPRMVPTRLSGKMTKIQIHDTATCRWRSVWETQKKIQDSWL